MSPDPSVKLDTRTTILDEAVQLFAETGYSGVSMRDIARQVGISAAALYHHFPDKESLYLAAIQHAFSDVSARFGEALEPGASAEERLRRFVRALAQLMGEKPLHRRLHQRLLLDGNETRLRMMATEIFEEEFRAVTALAREIAPGCDAHMLAFSISGMVIHHFEMAPLRRNFPGNLPEHDDIDYITDHVTQLLLHGIQGLGRSEP